LVHGGRLGNSETDLLRQAGGLTLTSPKHHYKRLFNGGFETANTHVTIEMLISSVGSGTAGDKSLLLAVIVKNLQ
jgi:hypothetical protein